jgi:hypothetical protein
MVFLLPWRGNTRNKVDPVPKVGNRARHEWLSLAHDGIGVWGGNAFLGSYIDVHILPD